jgi:hypothetical protein
MANVQRSKDDVLDALRRCATKLGRAPSKQEFKRESGITEYWWVQHFGSWSGAQRAAGLQPHTANIRLTDAELLEDWGNLVRERREIPTREQYRRDGRFSPSGIEKHFGPWSTLPVKFREYAADKPEWDDVLALLPRQIQPTPPLAAPHIGGNGLGTIEVPVGRVRHAKLPNQQVYGNPIDFRGLRHEPVNEQGVVFLFGMVAKELGYMVEAVQGAYPDCEAKRQIGPNHWQRVRIEFELESRNFRDHGHAQDGCDVIVCWRHNWSECPPHLQVVELSSVINSLSKSED